MALTLVPEAIEEYASAHTEPASPLFEQLRNETYAKMEMPQMQVGPIEGTFLRLLVRLARAKRVLEIGMFTGYSTLMMAEGLPEDGELITCEINPKAEEIARRYFAKSPHGKKIKIRMGPALQTIECLTGPLDLVFIDPDKENYPRYYDAGLPLLRAGGLVGADNVLWSGRVLKPKDQTDRAIHDFNETVAKDTRVAKLLPSCRAGLSVGLMR